MTTEIKALRPGEICLDYIPVDWPLTPLGANKNPYTNAWQSKPFGIQEIQEELVTGKCKAIGLISGPVFNHPYGLVWVDVDGLSVEQLIITLAKCSLEEALPKTLTIKSGKEGRYRKLYKVHRDNWIHFMRNKYVWHTEVNREQLEVLWSKHQGALMGLHPETDGYFTSENEGFEYTTKIPDLPKWILNDITNKNVRQGKPASEYSRVVGPGFAINTEITLERDIKLAQEAMNALPLDAVDDYDIWITIGQSLHSLDESLLTVWDDWSKQSTKYKDGECHRRWLSFSKKGGRSMGSLIHIAQQHGFEISQDHKAHSVDDELLNVMGVVLAKAEELNPTFNPPDEHLMSTRTSVVASLDEIIQDMQQPAKKPRANKSKEGKTENPPSSLITDQLVKLYAGNLLFNQVHNQFFLYELKHKGLWSPLTKNEVLGDLRKKLTSLEGWLPGGFTAHLMNDIYIQLQATLTFNKWYEGNIFLLFNNGILNVTEKKLLPFDRLFYLTQRLPYDYDLNAKCDPIIRWLEYTQRGDLGRVQVLRAWLRATLLSCYDIQRFVEIIGPGKSGKSTYANLAVALVGKNNTYSTDFNNLETNRFETIAFMNKKLLLFQDVDRWGGSVQKLKAITGGDWLRVERKYQAESQEPFQFHGLVMITANEALQSTDHTSGLARRRLTIPFDRPFEGTPKEQRELIKFDSEGNPKGEFAFLLPGLVNWLLDLEEDEMRQFLMTTSTKVPFFKEYEKTQSLRSNPILDWMEHKLYYLVGKSSPIGFAKQNKMNRNEPLEHYDTWLYPSYCEFCKESNVNMMSRNRFEPLFLDACQHQLKLNINVTKMGRVLTVTNVAIRTDSKPAPEYPSLVELSSDKKKFAHLYE